MAKGKKEPITEPIEEKVVEEVAVEQKNEPFVSRTLKAINQMQSPLKAERLANRLLRKARN